MMPKRIQRKRTRGWRLPEGAVCVTRPGRWGNPYVVGEDGDSAACVAIYRSHFWKQKRRWRFDAGNLDVSELRGKDLACWCHLCEKHKDGKPLGVVCSDCAPCHADVLLEIANREAKP